MRGASVAVAECALVAWSGIAIVDLFPLRYRGPLTCREPTAASRKTSRICRRSLAFATIDEALEYPATRALGISGGFDANE